MPGTFRDAAVSEWPELPDYWKDTYLRIFLDKTNASAIFTRSGMINGITHQPKTAPRPTAPVFLAYTTINHAVPSA